MCVSRKVAAKRNETNPAVTILLYTYMHSKGNQLKRAQIMLRSYFICVYKTKAMIKS